MGLLSIIRKIKRKEKEMRILMVYAQKSLSTLHIFDMHRYVALCFIYCCCRGLDNSGKTTIVLKINGEDTSVISPTLGFNIKTITYNKLASSSLLVSTSPSITFHRGTRLLFYTCHFSCCYTLTNECSTDEGMGLPGITMAHLQFILLTRVLSENFWKFAWYI